MTDTQWRKVFGASAWMVGLGIALYIVPLLNGMVAGFTGGYRAGTHKAAMIAAAFASLALAGVTFAFRASFVSPIWNLGEVAGIPLLPLMNAAALFLGAALGANFLKSPRHGGRLPPGPSTF